MKIPRQTQLDLGDGVTVYVIIPDGVLLDVIEDVDLGDRLEACQDGRTSLQEACLWAHLVINNYRRLRSPAASGEGPRPASPPDEPTP